MDQDVPRRLPKYCFEEHRPSGTRIRLRLPGRPTVTIPGAPWTPAFMEAYEKALRPDNASAVPATTAARMSWRWVCQRFIASNQFTNSGRTGKPLSPSHVLQQRRALEKTWGEPLAPGSADCFGDMPIEHMTPKAVLVLRDRLATTPDMANKRLKAMRKVLRFAVIEEFIAANPAREIGGFQIVTNGFYTWTEEDVARFEARHPAGSKARRAMYLMLFAGPRTCDLVQLGRQMLYKPVATGKPQLASRWLKFNPQKTANSTGKVLDIPVLPILQEELDLAPKNRMTFIETEYGHAFTTKGFQNWFKDRCLEAALPRCSAHGLRKAGATILAERGATPHQLMAIYGWSTVKEAERYTRAAQSKLLAEAGLSLHGTKS
jgi:site-specific recombinase XerD